MITSFKWEVDNYLVSITTMQQHDIKQNDKLPWPVWFVRFEVGGYWEPVHEVIHKWWGLWSKRKNNSLTTTKSHCLRTQSYCPHNSHNLKKRQGGRTILHFPVFLVDSPQHILSILTQLKPTSHWWNRTAVVVACGWGRAAGRWWGESRSCNDWRTGPTGLVYSHFLERRRWRSWFWPLSSPWLAFP